MEMRTKQNNSLNPYCSGRWSRTAKYINDTNFRFDVLILIVVEDGLVLQLLLCLRVSTDECLNPYCSGRWSRTCW